MSRPARPRGGRVLRALPALIALVAASGCATLPAPAPPAGPAGTGPARATATPVSDSGVVPPVPAPKPAASAVDTVPSAEAREVLATIPEPLKPEERVAPPAVASETPPVGTAEPADSSEAAEADSARAGIPVPTPTPVLGERPLPEVTTVPDTATSPAPPALAQGSAVAPVVPDTCWRVQIAAPAERVKAERYLEAGQSQLLVPMVIEKGSGLYKVRTRECLNGPAADALKLRAVRTGFAGAFRFREKKP